MEKVDTMEWKDGPRFTGGAVVVGWRSQLVVGCWTTLDVC
jgi:hypothetical protein